jgi:hypothetical protein
MENGIADYSITEIEHFCVDPKGTWPDDPEKLVAHRIRAKVAGNRTTSWSISNGDARYCPFCGKRLPQEVSS